VILKYRDDVEKVQKQNLEALVAQTRLVADRAPQEK
jgi:hypothetical protein